MTFSCVCCVPSYRPLRNCIGANDTIGPQCPEGPPPPERLAHGTSLIVAPGSDPKDAPRRAGDRFTWSVSTSGGDTWSRPRQHPDLVTPGCKGSLIGYRGSVYFSGPYSVTKRENLTILASDDNGERFTRSLQIVPPGHMSAAGFPTPGTGYSQLQCGLPGPLDCAVAFDDGQEFNYAWPYCNISWVRFASSDVK